MKEWLRRFILAGAYVVVAFSQLLQKSEAGDGKMSRAEVAAKLDEALRTADSLDDSERQISLFQSAAGEALNTMPANVLVEEAFQRFEQTKTTDPRKLAKEWRSALIEARDILLFEPVVESPLPEGFPELTPVGEIRLQQYPKYRLARTDMTMFESSAFWTLFNHIKERDIEMTAPVEMTYAPAAEGDKSTKKAAMSFMYRSTEQGELGTAGKVQVEDVPAQLAVSIGIRGNATKQRVADSKRRLECWLETHRDEYESAGPLRVMGHNSPFVAEKKQFAEVQIPVRKKQPGPAVTP